MFRLLVFLFHIIILVGIFLFLRTTTGSASIEWGSWHIELHTSLLVVAILFLLFLSLALSSFWYALRRFFDTRKHLASQKKSQHILDNLLLTKEQHLKGLDNTPLLPVFAEKKDPHPYVTLVRAENALRKGDLTLAENLFSSLLPHKTSTLSARIGLLHIAKARLNHLDTFSWGKKALEIAPEAPFVHEILLSTCQNTPELSEIYARDIAPLLKDHTLHAHKNLRSLYAEWLMDQSRQKSLSATLVKKDHKNAISLASKAFSLHPSSLSFERMIKSLIESDTPRHIKKAGKLIIAHWSSYPSLSLARIYRDNVLASKAPHQHIKALRQLIDSHHPQKNNSLTAGKIVLLETLILHGMRGEALSLLQNLKKTHPHHYEDTLASLQAQLDTSSPPKNTPSSSPSLPPSLPPDVPLRNPSQKHKKNL